jgi:hypothetical protein
MLSAELIFSNEEAGLVACLFVLGEPNGRAWHE